ncbi:adenylate kinase [Rubrivirga sp.]|uniref:adenylate kinase n=1 Tax=Rubrivirga sp. TaxID=1885344 RepID=UPI003C740BF0
MRLALFGPPGAGKGTQAKRLATAHDLAHLSTGDLFRAAIRDESDLGVRVASLLSAGELVPDDTTNAVVADRLETLGDQGFVLDGFPRTVAQAEWLMGHLAGAGKSLDAVVSLRVPEEDLVQRLSRRRTDAETGAIYHLDFNPPPSDLPPGRLVHRSDDQPEAIRHRLSVYERDTAPVEATLRAHVRYFEVDGTGALEDVQGRIEDAIAQDHGLAGI